MPGLSQYCVKYKKYAFILLTTLVIFVGLSCQLAWSHIGLPRIDARTLAVLEKQYPVVVLFRHAERCDRSDNTCLSDKTGITVHGAQQARALGASFAKDVAGYSLYASDTVRTIQSAIWFSASKKLTVDKNMHACGRGTEQAIKQIVNQSPNKDVVIFTHNHCLTYLAKNMRGVKFAPDYLDGLVMHAVNGKLFLDGQFVAR